MSRRQYTSALTMGLVMVLSLVLPMAASAQVRSMTRLGGATRFTAPVRSVEALKRTMSRPRTQRDIGTVLEKAGLSNLQAEVLRNLTEGTVTPSETAPGTMIEWMAQRRGGRPEIVTNARWDGRRPFKGFTFVIDDRVGYYTFVVPEDCGNLALLSRELLAGD